MTLKLVRGDGVTVLDRNGVELVEGCKARVVGHVSGRELWQMWSEKERGAYPVGCVVEVAKVWTEGTLSILRPNDEEGQHFVLPECLERIEE